MTRRLARLAFAGLFFLTAAPAGALEPVVDFAQIARVTQQLATSLKQLQVLTQSNGNLMRMLGAIGPLGEMAGLDASALGGLGSGGLEIGRLLDKSFPDGIGLGTLGSINLDDVGKWAIKDGVQSGLSARAIAGKAFDLTLGALKTQADAGADDVAGIFARGGYAGLESVPGVVEAIKRGARSDMQDAVDRAFGANAQLQAAGLDLGDEAASSLRRAIEGGADKQAIGRMAYQAILDGTASKGLDLGSLGSDALAGTLRDAGLKGLEKLPGLLDAMQLAGRNLGGLADLRELAPPAQLFRADAAASFTGFAAARDATRAALWSAAPVVDPITAQTIAGSRRRVQAEAIGTAYPLALRLRAELAKQPARLEALAEDAKAAATLNAQLRESNKAMLALVQSASRMEAAMAALLGLEAAAQMQAQPNGAAP